MEYSHIHILIGVLYSNMLIFIVTHIIHNIFSFNLTPIGITIMSSTVVQCTDNY